MGGITEMIISAVIKKGIVWEARKFETDVEIPDSNVTIKIRAEHMTIQLEKGNKEEA